MNIGVDVNNVRATEMVNPFYGQYSETSGVGGLISVSSERTFSVNQQYLLTYNKTFNDVHNVDILAGHESYDYKYQYLYGQREKLYDPNVPELREYELLLWFIIPLPNSGTFGSYNFSRCPYKY